MQTAKILPFNMESKDQFHARVEKYEIQQDDIKIMRKEVNTLSASVGDLVKAIQGDKMGNEGLLPRMEEIEHQQLALKKRLDDIELEAKRRGMYIMAIIGTMGIILGTLFKAIIDKISK